MLDRLITEVKDCLFPVHCLGCEKEGQWLCENCAEQIYPNGVFCCPLCHCPTNQGENCVACATGSYLTRQISITPYQEAGLTGEIIRTFKYNYAEDLQTVIKALLIDFIRQQAKLFFAVDAIVPVPLHSRRYAERGFNQAEIIAKIIAAELNKPVILALRRGRYTLQQAKLNRAERRANIQEAFQIKDNASGKVLLVDDVYTTGATMQECARVLKQSPDVKEVIGFTLARG